MKKKKLTFAFLLFLIFPFFFFFGPGYGSSRSFQCFWDLGHILFFALASYFLVTFVPVLGKKPYKIQIFWIVAITLLGGLLIELTQVGFSRTPGFWDMLRNLIGSFISLFFFNPGRKEWSAKRLHVMQFFTVLVVLAATIPFGVAITDEMVADAEFPLLADFETPLEKDRWEGGAGRDIVSDIASSGRCSLEVSLGTSTYSGISLVYFPADWQTYEVLSFDVYNPLAEPLRLTCRIHDQQHSEGVQSYDDRFNQSFTIQKGWNSIQVALEKVKNAPETRKMDMGDIRGLGIFATRLPRPRTIFLDNVRLRPTSWDRLRKNESNTARH